MRKIIMALSVCAAALLPALAATTASADSLPSEDIGQLSATYQDATSTATSTQVAPTNNAISVSILSPGSHSGDVTQTNSSTATSSAGNTNGTTQTATQSGGGGGTQAIGQSAKNDQGATSTATSTQDHPTNNAISVSILSPGSHSGDVTQTNSSTATSSAGNTNGTTQTATQSGGGGGTQAIGQSAKNDQGATSTATSTQDHPTNNAISVSILSPGSHSGDVTQTNSSTATSTAGNTNGTTQTATQSGSAPVTAVGGCSDACTRTAPCSGTCHAASPAVEAIGQLAASDQNATSAGTSQQSGARNVAAPVALLGGDPKADGCLQRCEEPLTKVLVGGNVHQSNTSSATSAGGNTNGTTQSADQSGGGTGGVQAIGQAAPNHQGATSTATSTQCCPWNLAGGGYGAVDQTNASAADSRAGNTNGATQHATQALAYAVPVT